jgi:soluble lytic murein transglycosylase-like protein
MSALIQQESNGDGTAVGPPTKYGRAYGSTQLQPATAKEMATKLGLPFRPDMLRSNDPGALKYQRALASAYLREGLERTGNITDALHYYHGGPDRSQWGPLTRAYANEVLARLQ